MGIFFELLVWLVVEVFGELVLEVVFAAFKDLFGRKNHHPVVASAGYLVLGAAIGGLTLWIHPERLLRAGPVPGLSVVLVPLAGGVVMHAWGRYQRANERTTTNLATFLGGASLLFAYSLVRFLWAR